LISHNCGNISHFNFSSDSPTSSPRGKTATAESYSYTRWPPSVFSHSCRSLISSRKQVLRSSTSRMPGLKQEAMNTLWRVRAQEHHDNISNQTTSDCPFKRWLLDPRHVSIAHGHQTNLKRDGCYCRRVLFILDLVVTRRRRRTSSVNLSLEKLDLPHRLPHWVALFLSSRSTQTSSSLRRYGCCFTCHVLINAILTSSSSLVTHRGHLVHLELAEE
jgi:hypothetical protein